MKKLEKKLLINPDEYSSCMVLLSRKPIFYILDCEMKNQEIVGLIQKLKKQYQTNVDFDGKNIVIAIDNHIIKNTLK